MQKRRSLAFLRRLDNKFGWTFFGFMFALLLAELTLRFVGFSRPILHRPERLRGFAGRPNAFGWYTNEGRAFVRMNRDGLRDDDHTTEKPPNTLRIAILGDSFAEALQVSADKTFWSILQQELNDCPGLVQQDYQTETINFGVSGYGTAQQLLTLQHHVWKYDPDIILLAFLPDNDIRDNSKVIEPWHLMPYFIYDEDGNLVLDGALQETQARRFSVHELWPTKLAIYTLNHSRVIQLLYVHRSTIPNYLSRLFKSQQVESEVKQQKVEEVVDLPNQVYSNPVDPDWVEAWQITEDLLSQMIQETHSNDAQFFMTVLTNPEAVNPDSSVGEKILESYQADDFEYPHNRLKSFSEEQGVDGFFSLLKPFQKYASENQVCLHGFEGPFPCSGHWNEAGHRLAGELIATKMCSNLKNDSPNLPKKNLDQ